MEKYTRAEMTEPVQPTAEPEEGEMPDEELDEVDGGTLSKYQKGLNSMQNYWKVLTDTLKSGSEVQGKISGNLR